MKSSTMRRILISVLSILVLVAAMFGASAARANAPAAIKYGGTVTVVPNGSPGAYTQNFNPYASAVLQGSQGMVYEPLLIFNQIKGGAIIKWLASGFKWSNGNKTLTFTLRSGVKWNDGQPFTSADVAYSLQLDKVWGSKGFAPCNNCWNYVKNVTTPDARTVVINFKTVNTTSLWYIGGNMYVLPKHVWSKVSNPVLYTDPNPVGTGAFKLTSFSPQVYTLGKNKLYWQKGKPYVSALRYPSYTSNTSSQLDLVNGTIDWAGIFIPSAQEVYVAAHPSTNHYWFPALSQPTAIFLNDQEAPFNNVHVRRAISLALDRTSFKNVAEYGYEPGGNGAYIQPQFVKTWGDSTAMKTIGQSPNITKAKAELALAPGVDISKNFTIQAPNGWTDWNTMESLIANDLKAIGMNVTVQQPDYAAWADNLNTGKFDMIMRWTDASYSPFSIYQNQFWSKNSAPIGQIAASNYERYSNPTMDSLITQYQRASKLTQQVALMKKMEKLAASEVPIVPLTIGCLWYEYNTSRFTGWPTAKNPYVRPSPYAAPEDEITALTIHLK
jgi:peptide/nickel transport system substrate-binding protein